MNPPFFSKKLLCPSPACRTCFASMDERKADQSIYVLESSMVFNWEIRASNTDEKISGEKSWPVVCIACKRECGVYHQSLITFHSFQIKSVVPPTILIGEL